ncbi:4-(cytidine 5'-diphospho)-2-C-methyl-D-erythritol kinase [Desulfoprunum benzoelyticum]|uniref:4-(cytidine 5'-diphospho)-2-C-methyl-D-erythritol kinase n=1 Tax=Desulfoprunum benzoelyticum TaxID=1506996 RepID=UPI001615C467|nr:4-(cytidine 5'-diphospho)-2-C-methyl-D-erythritol kinase [Desulfoprunum benzoelyticum]MBM9529932.1 4-(cytidine 5'-diphospho)-2-C-methyl-D-erythritol kinase [Desulfoprunum benzoelyticum]
MTDFNHHRAVVLLAPAKINLFLHVRRKRADGYHDLETWMQKLDFGDTIELCLRKDGLVRLDCSDPSLPADRSNLAWKAADAFFFASRRGKGCGVDIRIGKRIPVAAGLGGGSSDAGTVLRGLNSLFDSEFSRSELCAMALRLGADVPFFVVEDDAVLAEGVGEVMYPVPSLKGYSVLLVNPGFSVSTRWVYENLGLTSTLKESKLASFRKDAPDTPSLGTLSNDLERVTLAQYPELASIKENLLEAGAEVALMSGSGPTVYGLFPDVSISTAEMQTIAVRMKRKFGKMVFVARAKSGASPSGKGTGF